jgi:hypothetical protein
LIETKIRNTSSSPLFFLEFENAARAADDEAVGEYNANYQYSKINSFHKIFLLVFSYASLTVILATWLNFYRMVTKKETQKDDWSLFCVIRKEAAAVASSSNSNRLIIIDQAEN